MSTVKNITVEVIESRLPVMVDQAGLRPDSGGAGEYRGGLGSIRDYRFLAPFGALTILKKSATFGWGLKGGKPGPKNLTVLHPNTNYPEWQKHMDQDITIYADHDEAYENTDETKKYCGQFRGEFHAGDMIRYLADGGGGYGEPFHRPAEKVREDVIDGLVSRKAAETDYGVILSEELDINWSETNRLRGISAQ